MPLQEPPAVVAFDERADLVPGLFEALEVMEVQALFLQRPDEAFRDAFTLRLPHVEGRRADPEPAELALELMGRVLRVQWYLRPSPRAIRGE